MIQNPPGLKDHEKLFWIMLSGPCFVTPLLYNGSMSNRDYSNPSSMIDVYLRSNYDGESISVTVYDGDWTEVDNLLHRNYSITKTEVIL